MAEDIKSTATDFIKKILTVSVGTLFLTEEALKGLITEFKLPKEMVTGLLDSANKTKKEFFAKLSEDTIGKVMNQADLPKLVDEFFHKNDVEFNIKVRVNPRESAKE